MSFPSPAALGKFILLAGMAVGFAACSGSSSPSPVAYPAPGSFPTTYGLMTILNPPKTSAFDIGFVDETAHMYLLADKTTNGVDVVDSLATKYLGTAGAGKFQGAGTIPPNFAFAGARSPNGGPNGVVSLGGGIAAAGDGDSSLEIVNFATITPTVIAKIPVGNPYTGPALGPGICQPQPAGAQPDLGTPTVGAGNYRVDELAYDPTDNVILAVSDDACPVFMTFFQGTAPYTILHQTALLTANGGGEQPVWDPTQGKFLVAIPSTTVHPNGEIEVSDPKTFANSAIGLPVPCGPSGFALGKNETIVAACGQVTSMMTFNAVTFAALNNAPGPSPDEIWYSPGSNRFYGADTGGATLAVLDGSGNMLFRTPTFAGSHSVAVESLNDHVFVPVNGGANVGLNIFDH